MGDQQCPGKADEGTILAFSGFQHPLSNHYPTPIKAFNEAEPFKSIEHALFWKMAIDLHKPTLAEQIRNAKHAGIAKRLSKEMSDDDRR